MPDTARDLIKQTISNTPGTAGSLTLSAASTGYLALGASDDGKTFTVLVSASDSDTASKELRSGCTYTHSTTTLTRGTLESSSTGSAISLTSSAIVSVILPASTGNVIENFLGAWGALSGENSITGTATAVIGRLNVCSGTTADYTVTLPAVSGNAGKYIGFIMASGLTKLVTLDGNASETIDGATTRVMWAKETALLYCDGTTWTKVAGKSLAMSGAVARTTAQTGVATGTATKCTCNVSVFDNGGIVDATNGYLVAKRPGTWAVSAVLLFGDGAGSLPFGTISDLTTYIYKAGAQYSATATYSTAGANVLPAITAVVPVVAGDTVAVYGYHNKGANASFWANSGQQCNISAVEEPSW